MSFLSDLIAQMFVVAQSPWIEVYVQDERGRREDMADIAAIDEMLSGLRQALEIVKFLAEHNQEQYGHKLTELGQMLGAIRGKLFEAQTMAELEKNFQTTSTLLKLNDAYYEVDENNHPTGEAYCMHCWEANVIKHHLHRW